jgi:glutathione peroxidase
VAGSGEAEQCFCMNAKHSPRIVIYIINETKMEPEFYKFSAKTLQGKDVSMSEYEGKVILVVNTASKCGLTPQYEGLQKLYEQYEDRGLVILGFPCNQFANQEPGDESSIAEGCLVNYGVTFPMFSKIEVNGNGTHPIFKYLKEQLGGVLGSRLKWNFTKFLLNAEGTPIKRYAPTTKPESIASDIEGLLPVAEATN